MFSSTPSGGADPYVPGHGDLAFGVDSYDLTLDYTPAGNRLDATAVLACRIVDDVPEASLDDGGVRRIELDLHHRLKVAKLTVSGATTRASDPSSIPVEPIEPSVFADLFETAVERVTTP